MNDTVFRWQSFNTLTHFSTTRHYIWWYVTACLFTKSPQHKQIKTVAVGHVFPLTFWCNKWACHGGPVMSRGWRLHCHCPQISARTVGGTWVHLCVSCVLTRGSHGPWVGSKLAATAAAAAAVPLPSHPPWGREECVQELWLCTVLCWDMGIWGMLHKHSADCVRPSQGNEWRSYESHMLLQSQGPEHREGVEASHFPDCMFTSLENLFVHVCISPYHVFNM